MIPRLLASMTPGVGLTVEEHSQKPLTCITLSLCTVRILYGYFKKTLEIDIVISNSKRSWGQAPVGKGTCPLTWEFDFWTHIKMEGENLLHVFVLWPTHMSRHTYNPTHKHISSDTNITQKPLIINFNYFCNVRHWSLEKERLAQDQNIRWEWEAQFRSNAVWAQRVRPGWEGWWCIAGLESFRNLFRYIHGNQPLAGPQATKPGRGKGPSACAWWSQREQMRLQS